MQKSLTVAFTKVEKASRTLATLDPKKIDRTLLALASALERASPSILRANAKDLRRKNPRDPTFDRLKLTKERIAGIAKDLRTVARLPSPLHRILEKRTVKSGLHLEKRSVPLGIIGMIYEARPNVTVDAFSLCFKSGNACILKGGSDADDSNKTLVDLIHKVLKKNGIDPHILLLLPPDRTSVSALLNAEKFVDVIIPRGNQSLINFVRKNATVPVIETGAGIVHTYLDRTAEVTMAAKIVDNAKTRRVSVCNALDTLLVHRSQLKNLPSIVRPMEKKRVIIFADPPSYRFLSGYYSHRLLKRAKPRHFGTEFLALKLSIKTVKNLDEAIDHITRFGSKHSEAIISSDKRSIERFFNEVDAASVYANTSTAFSDGAEYGMGAEIGVSNQKLHARGPMGLPELTSYKWVVRGRGQVRPA